MEVAAREQQIYSTKHPSARIVFSVEEVLTGQVMVFLSLVQFLPVREIYSNWHWQLKIDGVASAVKDHRAGIKSIQRKHSTIKISLATPLVELSVLRQFTKLKATNEYKYFVYWLGA